MCDMENALSHAIEGRHQGEKREAPYFLFIWNGDPGWRFAHKIAGLQYDLSELLRCPVKLIGCGPGCFYAAFHIARELSYESFISQGLRAELKSLKLAYEADKLTLVLKSESRLNKKLTVH